MEGQEHSLVSQISRRWGPELLSCISHWQIVWLWEFIQAFSTENYTSVDLRSQRLCSEVCHDKILYVPIEFSANTNGKFSKLIYVLVLCQTLL